MRVMVLGLLLAGASLLAAGEGESWLSGPGKAPAGVEKPSRPIHIPPPPEFESSVSLELLDVLTAPSGAPLRDFGWQDDGKLLWMLGDRFFHIAAQGEDPVPTRVGPYPDARVLGVGPRGRLAVGTSRGEVHFQGPGGWMSFPYSIRKLPALAVDFLPKPPRLAIGGREILHVIPLALDGGSSATLDAKAWALDPTGHRAARIDSTGRPFVHSLYGFHEEELSIVKPGPYRCMTFSSDGSMLLTGREDGWVQSFRLEGKRGTHNFRQREQPVTAVSYSPGLGRIAVAYADGLVQLSAYRGLKDQGHVRLKAGFAEKLAFSPDGRELDFLSRGQLYRFRISVRAAAK